MLLKKTKKKKVVHQRRKKQTGGFLNIYDFAYIDRDVVNQAGKVAPGVIKGATNEINNVEKQRIDQIILQGGKQVEHVLPKIIRGAIKMCIRHHLDCS